MTLHGILESKDGNRIQKLSSFFTNLIRDYSEAGCVQEASLLTQLWTWDGTRPLLCMWMRTASAT